MPLPVVTDLDDVRRVRFDRPRQLNAITRDDVRTVTAAVRSLPPQVAAVVFCGTGATAFSAGVHTDVFDGLSTASAREFISELGEMLGAVRRAPVPTLCSVGGYCLGGAMELAMACDLRVASTTALFGMPEIKVGIPSVLDAALLQQHVGLSKAREILLTGDLYTAEEMDRFGFLNVVVPPEELESATSAMVRRVATHSRPATAAQKRLFETWQNCGLQASVEASVGEFAEVFGHPETLDHVRAYRARRG
jgi:enoyl-CoA hydratase/carnithine racemase